MLAGSYTYGTPDLRWVSSGAKMYCGKFCSIAGGVKVYLGGNHRTDWVTTYPFGHTYQHVFNTFNGAGHPATKGDVIVGNDVWIGDNVTIMSGVTIHDGAVIANNSHVVKDVPAYALVGGNPAKVVRLRFTPEQIEKLLKIQWWNWPEDKINKYTTLLCSPNVDDFIAAAEQNTL